MPLPGSTNTVLAVANAVLAAYEDGDAVLGVADVVLAAYEDGDAVLAVDDAGNVQNPFQKHFLGHQISQHNFHNLILMTYCTFAHNFFLFLLKEKK